MSLPGCGEIVSGLSERATPDAAVDEPPTMLAAASNSPKSPPWTRPGWSPRQVDGGGVPDLGVCVSSQLRQQPRIAARVGSDQSANEPHIVCGELSERLLRAGNLSGDPRTYLCVLDPSELLASDNDPGVRYSAARNPNCDAETLAVLASDLKAGIRNAAALNPNCDTQTLAVLGSDKDVQVRLGAARNPNCDAETLAALASDDDCEVRRNVAHNPRCVPRVVASLAADPDLAVAAAAATALAQRFARVT